jgi:TAT (twin-arginine translocation) pathway signal sequence
VRGARLPLRTAHRDPTVWLGLQDSNWQMSLVAGTAPRFREAFATGTTGYRLGLCRPLSSTDAAWPPRLRLSIREVDMNHLKRREFLKASAAFAAASAAGGFGCMEIASAARSRFRRLTS